MTKESVNAAETVISSIVTQFVKHLARLDLARTMTIVCHGTQLACACTGSGMEHNTKATSVATGYYIGTRRTQNFDFQIEKYYWPY